jgi:hypothetical protein
MITPRPYLIQNPRPVILVCSEQNLHFWVWVKEYNAAHGAYAAQKHRRSIIPRFDCLQFNYGWQDCAVQPIEPNRLLISSKALIQLMFWFAIKNDDKFSTDDLRHFFEGNELNSARKYFENVALPVWTGSNDRAGSVQRYSIDRDGPFLRSVMQ